MHREEEPTGEILDRRPISQTPEVQARFLARLGYGELFTQALLFNLAAEGVLLPQHAPSKPRSVRACVEPEGANEDGQHEGAQEPL